MIQRLLKPIKNNSISLKEYKEQLSSPKDKSINKGNFELKAKYLGYKVEPEFKFLLDRKFRADWKVSKEDKSILVEYEGIKSSKNRHISLTGYSKDCEKYNLAQIHGYKVLRYTIINFYQVFKDLEKFFCQD